jgi:cysteine desulfurase/selenocysteine lyase
MTLTDVRDAFPALGHQVNGHRLVYLDSAATALKPRPVVDAVAAYYSGSGVTVHRSVHTLAAMATEAYEGARETAARFIGAAAPDSIVFTRGTTEAINLVARGWAEPRLQPGDEIVLTVAEHHSNLVPWQRVARVTGARLVFAALLPDGRLSLEEFRNALSPRTRLVALSGASNVLGTVLPVGELTRLAHQRGAAVLIDGAQLIPHQPVSVGDLDVDFLAFSGHKLGGPTGIGVLYGKPERLLETDPLMLGGEMIEQVELTTATWAEVPARFEGGTPNVAGVIGLQAALEFLTGVGMDAVAEHDRLLAEAAYDRLMSLSGVEVYGPARPRSALVSFNVHGVHPHDVAQVLDAEGIAIRAGHHCAQPLMEWLHVGSTCRASFYLYNTEDDLDALVHGIRSTERFFGRGA